MPANPFLRQATILDKEAVIRKRLVKTDSDIVRADAVRVKADAAHEAAKRMHSAKTEAERTEAMDHWEQAMKLPGAEEAAAQAKVPEETLGNDGEVLENDGEAFENDGQALEKDGEALENDQAADKATQEV